VSHVHDAVIVGGGFAGLSAAHELRDLDLVLLEREPRVGGRVLTRHQGGTAFDLGAVLAVDPANSPLKGEGLPALFTESERVALFMNGVTHFGPSVIDCVKAAVSGSASEALERFIRDPSLRAEQLPAPVYRALNAYFRAIHPGELREYLSPRQRDSTFTFPVRHWKTGNSFISDRLAEALGERVWLGSEVSSISQAPDLVELVVKRGSHHTRLRARSVICCTPSPVAKQLLASQEIDSNCRSFLDSLRWGEGTVVALGLSGAQLSDFSYLVSPELNLNTVVLHRGMADEPDVLLAYYVCESSMRLKTLQPAQIVEQTLRELAQLKIGDLTSAHVLWSEVHRWQLMGVHITQASYGNWSEANIRPSERVFLAGDYTFFDPANPFPFGTNEALHSGKRAALQARSLLSRDSSSHAIHQD
jgi:monoamine oxidase